MSSILNRILGRRTQNMQAQANELRDDLKKMGNMVKISYESTARQDQLAAIDDYIRSPLTTIPDKIDAADSLILRNLMWGTGRTDALWTGTFIDWKTIYSNWLLHLSLVESFGTSHLEIQYEELELNPRDATEIWTKKSHRMINPESLGYYFLNKERFREVKVLQEIPTPPVPRKFGSPNINVQKIKESVMSYGREFVLQDAQIALNFIYTPDQINTQYVLVMQGLMQPGQFIAPTGSRAAKPNQGGQPGIQET